MRKHEKSLCKHSTQRYRKYCNSTLSEMFTQNSGTSLVLSLKHQNLHHNPFLFHTEPTICHYFLSCPYLIHLCNFSYLDHRIFSQIHICINFLLLMPTSYKCQDIHCIPGHSVTQTSSTFHGSELSTVLLSVVSGTVIISLSDSKFQIFTITF